MRKYDYICDKNLTTLLCPYFRDSPNVNKFKS